MSFGIIHFRKISPFHQCGRQGIAQRGGHGKTGRRNDSERIGLFRHGGVKVGIHLRCQLTFVVPENTYDFGASAPEQGYKANSSGVDPLLDKNNRDHLPGVCPGLHALPLKGVKTQPVNPCCKSRRHFFPKWPDFPMPLTTIFPRAVSKQSTAMEKFFPRQSEALIIEFASLIKTLCASANSCWLSICRYPGFFVPKKKCKLLAYLIPQPFTFCIKQFFHTKSRLCPSTFCDLCSTLFCLPPISCFKLLFPIKAFPF